MMYFVFYQLKAKNITLDELFSGKLVKHWYAVFYLLFAILLMPFNWYLETLKWKTLVNEIQAFSFQDAIQAVLIGVFLGFVTPNRMGEFGGRLFKINQGSKIKAFSLAFRGGMAQFLVTFSIGLLSTFLVYKHLILSNLYYFALVVLSFFILWLYFNFNKVVLFLARFSLLKKWINLDIIEANLSHKTLVNVFFITLIRYLVYVNQYVLIAYFFSIDVNYLFLFSSVSAMLLTQTLGPSFPLIDLGLRGGVLLLLLENFTDNQLSILLVILIIWVLNLVIPAIVGYFYLLKVKLASKEVQINAN